MLKSRDLCSSSLMRIISRSSATEVVLFFSSTTRNNAWDGSSHRSSPTHASDSLRSDLKVSNQTILHNQPLDKASHQGLGG